MPCAFVCQAKAKASQEKDEEMTDVIESAARPEPSAAAARWRVGERAVAARQDSAQELRSPLGEDGSVADWDALEAVWDHALRERLQCDPREHPLMCSEPTVAASASQRQQMAELAFEKLGVPAFFLAKSPVLSAFATGRATGLVVDVGHHAVSVTPVHDGYALQRCSIRSGLAGRALSGAMLGALEAAGTRVRPRYTFSKKETSPGEFEVKDVDVSKVHDSFKRFKQMEIIHDLMESTCHAGEEPFDEAQMAKVPTVSYELPDGTTVEMGADRYKLPECHFDPALYQTFAGAPPMPVLKPWAAPKEAAGEDTHMGTVKVCVCENACQPGSLCRAPMHCR